MDTLGRVLGGIVTGGATVGYEVAGAAPTPGLVAALASWCAETGRLITLARTTGGSLEDTYLELVTAGRGDEAERPR